MTEKIPLFKKEIDDIHVPTDKLDAIIFNTVQKASIQQKLSKTKKVLYSVSAAVVAFGVLLGSATVSPAMASVVSNIPIIGAVFSESGDRGLKQVSELGLTNLVGESQTVGDTTITIDEVFYDDTRFNIGFSLESKVPLGQNYLSSGPDFTIDGRSISWGGGYGETKVTSTLRTGILRIDPLEKLPESFTLGLTFNGEDGKQWEFSLPIKAHTDIKYVAVDHIQDAGGIDLHVTDLKMSPAGMLVSFKAESEEMDYLAGNLDFKIVDENGNEIASHSGASQSEFIRGMEFTTGSRLFDPVDANVKEVTMTPYLVLPTGGGGVEFDAEGNETEIEFEPRRGEEIKFKSFKVVLP